MGLNQISWVAEGIMQHQQSGDQSSSNIGGSLDVETLRFMTQLFFAHPDLEEVSQPLWALVFCL